MAEENEQQQGGKSGGKGLIIVLIALVVILLFAVVGGAYFLYSQGVLSPQNQNQEQTTKKEEAGEAKEMYKAEINDLVLNITNSKGREKLMKLSFAIKSVQPDINGLVEKYRAEIIDVVISQISARSSVELLTVGGKALLKDELVDDMERVINNVTATNEDVKSDNSKQIRFTTFVIK